MSTSIFILLVVQIILIILNAIFAKMCIRDRTTAEAPKWEFIAARLLNHSFRCRNAQEWEGRGVGDLYGRLRYLTDKGLYGDYILAHYTHEEIAMAEGFLCPERDELFTYSGLDLLLKRYRCV